MKMQRWQLDMLDKMSGFKPGELVMYGTGRRSGKSMMTAQAIDRLMKDLITRPIEQLVLSEGRVYGALYYCVEPIGGSWIEMQEWCLNQFGDYGKHIWGAKETPEPQQRWYMNNRKFWFRDDEDRLMFVLKWR